MRNFRFLITGILSSFLTIHAVAQNKLDAVVSANVKLEQEIAEMDRLLGDIRAHMRKTEAEMVADSIILHRAMHERDSLLRLNTKENLALMVQDVARLEKRNDELLKEVERCKQEFVTKRQTLVRNQSDMAGMSAFEKVQRQKTLEANMQYTKVRYSEMQLSKLETLLGHAADFSDMNAYEEYVKRLRFAIANKKIYEKGVKAINSPLDFDYIVSIRDVIIPILELKQDDAGKGMFKLFGEQFGELDTLDIKLSRYKDGVKYLDNTIRAINGNREIRQLRAIGNPQERTRLLNLMKPYVFPEEGTERSKKHQIYFEMVPYLKDLLKRYWREVQDDPFAVPTKTECDVESMVVEK